MSFYQVDSLHQQIVIEILVNLQQKVQTDFSKTKGKDKSCYFEVYICIITQMSGRAYDVHVVKGQKVRSTCFISELVEVI